eukprot:PhM_4_TR10382/c1_g1_i1/m.31136/K06184/ABCF1; ATP-binding cassette, subfamily F, member 1
MSKRADRRADREADRREQAKQEKADAMAEKARTATGLNAIMQIAEDGETAAAGELYNTTFEPVTMGANDRNILCKNFTCSIQGKELFKNTEVNFSAGNRYGLMGPNGRGKSSLLRLLEERRIPIGEKLRVQLVEQEQEVTELDTPAVQVVIQSDTRRTDLLKEEEELMALDTPTDEQHDRLMEVQEELAATGADSSEALARRILYGLGFPTEWHERHTRTFSGGWRKRIALACAVFMEPDFLMLDEPTNHLDLNAVTWLQNYLPKVYNSNMRKPKTLVVVSHDVEFLDSVCTHMVHIDNCLLQYYTGSYYDFLTSLSAKRREYDNKFEKQRKEIRSYKRNQHMSKKQIDKIFENRARKEGRDLHDVVLEKRKEYTVTFPFEDPPPLRDTECLVKLDDVSFNYPGCPTLYENVSIAVWSDSRICLVGPNGIGKSTLLNLMDGTLEPTEGMATFARNSRIGRYNQHFVDKMPLELTGVELMMQRGGFIHEHEARQRLGSFGLEGIAHHQKIETLSGGQKARVAMAFISTEKPHLLMLDEPTNHLDMESINALVDAINNFQGGVIVVTHDARLIMDTEMSLWLVANKTVTPFDGELEDYKEHVLETLREEEERREAERDAKKQARQTTISEREEQKGNVSEKAKVAVEAKEKAAKEQKGKLDALFSKKTKKK